MAYLKPQSPIKDRDGDYIYPLTAVDQVIMEDGRRLNAVLIDMADDTIVPIPTADDNGKILKVVNGYPTWVEGSGLEDDNKVPLPVLDDTLPADVTCIIGDSVECNVLVFGNTDDYTYQWYANETAILGATEPSCTIITDTIGVMTVYCNVINSNNNIVASRVATIIVKSGAPEYTYSGSSVLTKEDGTNWNIKFTTSGNLNFTELGNGVKGIDVCLVGGGVGGTGGGGGGGAGGAVVNTSTNLNSNNNYAIVVGAANGQSSAFGFTASAGRGSPGGATGTNGADGTHAFNDTKYARYGAGGGGGGYASNYGYGGGTVYPAGKGGDYGGGNGGEVYRNGGSAVASTGGGGGGGGGGSGSDGGAGGSGIVIIRNKRS